MKKIFLLVELVLLLTGIAFAAPQRKDCEELKAEIAAKLDAKGVENYTLEIVPAENVKDTDQVVGTCDGRTKRIVYKRN